MKKILTVVLLLSSLITGAQVIYEAEDATLTGVSVVNSLAGYSGTGHTDGATFTDADDKIVFTVTVANAGEYPLVIRFANTCGVCEKYQNVKINSAPETYAQFNAISAGWNELNYGNISLNSGTNTITLTRSWGWTHFDCIKVGYPDSEKPTAPAGVVSSEVTETSFKISWTASTDNTGVTGYELFLDGTLKSTYTSTSAIISGLVPGKKYKITVKAKDAAGNISDASEPLEVTTAGTPDTQAPTAPTGLSASNIKNRSFTLSWNAASDNVGVVSYEVFVNDVSKGTSNKTSMEISGLSCNTPYTVTVKSTDASGNTSPASDPKNLTTAECGNAPMTIGTNFWNMTWGGADPFAKGYTNAIDPAKVYDETYNPWKTALLDELKTYTCLRFMDYGMINNQNPKFRTPSTWNGKPEINWSDRVPDNRVNQSHMSIYWMIDLCNKSNTDIWICMPEMSTENYWEGAATLIKQYLKPNLKVYVEYSNEVWNGQFSSKWTALDAGSALNLYLPGDPHEGYGNDRCAARYTAYISIRIWKKFMEVFGNESARVEKVLSGQATNDWLNACILHAATDPAVNPYPTIKPDAFAIAPYFSNSNQSYSSISGANADVQNIEKSIIKTEKVIDGTSTENWYAQTPCSMHDLPLICYEGGQHYVSNSNLFATNPQSYDVYTNYLNMLNKHIKGIMCHYVHSGTWGGMAWGAKNDIGQALSSAHKYRAIVDWVNSNNDYPVSIRTANEPNEDKIRIFPNPTSELINIDLSSFQNSKTTSIRIIDLMGKTVFQTTIMNENLFQIPVKTLNKGIYVIEILNNSKSYFEKVIVH